jgi:transcriptional regulator with XRE-family HTH domain
VKKGGNINAELSSRDREPVYVRVREAVDTSKYSRRELCARLGVPKEWLTRRLNGTITLSADDVQCIADVLDVAPGSLFTPVAGGPEPDDYGDRLALEGLLELVAAWRDLPPLELEALRQMALRRHQRGQRRGPHAVEEVVPPAEAPLARDATPNETPPD